MTDSPLNHSRTSDAQTAQLAVAGIVKGVAIKTSLIVLVAAAVDLAYVLVRHGGERWWFDPLSILFGGALGLLNFRWLAFAVERIYLRKGATPGLSKLAASIISVLKLSAIFIILFVVIKWQLMSIFALVGGLSLSFLAILWEGAAMMMKQNLRNGGP
jgi:ATP synthase I subunit